MPQFGEVRVDFITFTTGVSPEASVTVPVSGLVKNPTFSGDVVIKDNLDVEGNITISGTVTGNAAGFTSVTGTTVTGTTANFVTISGTTVTGNTGNFTTVTTTTANVTSGIFASGTAAAPSVSVGTTNNGLYSPGANQVAVSTTGTGRLFIDSSGNVGIGTSSPGAKFELSGSSSAAEIRLRSTDTTNVTIRSYVNSLEAGKIAFTSGRELFIETAGSERLRIDSSGNVGIGTSSPGNSLEVVGDYSSGPEGHGTLNITSNNTGNVGADARPSIGFSAPFAPSSVRILYGLIEGRKDPASGQGSTKGFLAFSTSPETSTGPVERMRIDSSGNVGIGTTSPTSLLTVGSGATVNPAAKTTIHDSTYSEFRLKLTSSDFNSDGRWLGLGIGYHSDYLKTAIISECKDAYARANMHFCTEATPNSTNVGLSNSRMTITYDGKVGISTTSPAYKLVVSNGGASGIEFGPAYSGTANLIQHYNRSGAAYVDAVNEAAQHRFHISGSEKARIDSSGNVGIGTSSPSSLLHVSGTAGTPVIFERTGSNGVFFGLKDGSGSFSYIGNTNGVFSIQTPGSSYSDKLVITSAGNVGIGTSSPGGNLDVRGLSGTSIVKAVGADSNGNADVEIVSTGTTGNSRLYFSDTAAKSGSITYSHADNSLAFATSATERMRIDSSGRLLVGASSAVAPDGTNYPAFQVNRPQSSGLNASALIREVEASTSWPILYINKNRQNNPMTADNKLGSIDFYGDTGSSDKLAARIEATAEGTWTTSSHPTRLVFSTCALGSSSPTERMRIDSAGSLIYGTSTSPGADITSGTGFYYQISTGLFYVRSNNSPVAAFNRGATDGTLVEFKQDQVTEGTISVSGSTVSYNGAHLSRWSQLPSGAERTEIFRGTVLSNLDEMCEWGDEDNEQLNRMQVSNVEGDKNVAGVFQAWDDDDDTYTNDFYCAMTGDFVIRIAQGTTVARGDLLMSAGDGTAKPQDDDIIRSKTIAKVTSTIVSQTYSDGSYCVPCVLMAC